MLPGEKAKLVNFLDNMMSELRATYSIEVHFTTSPKREAKCGAIVIFKLNDVDMEFSPGMDPRVTWEMQKQLHEETEVMYMEPIYFRKEDGQWIGWALEKALTYYDKLNGNAQIVVKSRKLKIKKIVYPASIAAGRSDTRSLFKIAWEIDRLLNGEFSFDPWTRMIRRGSVGADFARDRLLKKDVG
jgi:hypothetical protein